MTPNGVALYRWIPLPTIVQVIPVPLIASRVAFMSPSIPAVETCSSAVEDVAGGLTPAMLHLDTIV